MTMQPTHMTSRFSSVQMLAGFVVLVGVVVVFLVLSLVNEYRDTNDHARANVENLSRMLAEHVQAIVQKSDLLLREVQRNVQPADMRLLHAENSTRRRELHALLVAQRESVPEVAVIHITDARGNHVYSSLDPVPRINIADRYHFTRHRDDAAAGLVISPPVVSRTTGKWTFVLTRRLAFEDGSFAGIVNVILNLDYFQKFYSTLSLGNQGAVALYSLDFHLAARYPPSEKGIGMRIANADMQGFLDKGLALGVYRGISQLDGIERLSSFRRVDVLPLIVSASIAADDYLADWRLHVWRAGGGAVIFILVVAGFGMRLRGAEQELRVASLYGRSLIEASLDPLVTIGADGKIMDVNSATENVTGLPRDRLIGSDFAEYFTEPEQARRGYQLVFSQGQVTDYPLAIRHASGQVTEVLYNASVYRDAQGQAAGVFAAARDITERKQTELELQRSNAELEQFAYAISHDMRQPLRMVSSYLQLIEKALRDRLDDETRQYLVFAKEGAQRMDGMIRALLDFSRVGRKTDPLSRLEIRTTLDEALAFLGPELNASGGAVTVSGDWPALLVSRDEMVRLFQNLVGNALKYHEDSQAPEIEVQGQMLGNVWRCEVRDRGVGIDPTQIDRLFKVFSRLQSHARFEGAGVGLALCRKIVEHHGGRIGVESAGLGRGSMFWFELPVRNLDQQAGGEAP
jgi:PAS domain S-box-containing protein